MPDEVTLDMEVDSDDEATDDPLDELLQLAQRMERIYQQHLEALFTGCGFTTLSTMLNILFLDVLSSRSVGPT